MICIKILGKGSQGIAFLTNNNRVIKIQPVKNKRMSTGDYFGINVAPYLQPYFTIIYDVKFVNKNNLDKIICKDKSTINMEKFNDYPYYKISTMEFAGDTIGFNDWTNENCLKCFNDLLNPVLKMNSMGYFHNDLYFGNVTLLNGNFKVIDYDKMNKNKSIRDIWMLTTFLMPSISFIWWHPKYKNYLHNFNYNKKLKMLKKYYDGPTKYCANSYLFVYMGLYHPKLFFNIFLHDKISGGNIPRDIERTLFEPTKIMKILYLINTTFRKNNNKFIHLSKFTHLSTRITNILQSV